MSLAFMFRTLRVVIPMDFLSPSNTNATNPKRTLSQKSLFETLLLMARKPCRNDLEMILELSRNDVSVDAAERRASLSANPTRTSNALIDRPIPFLEVSSHLRRGRDLVANFMWIEKPPLAHPAAASSWVIAQKRVDLRNALDMRAPP